MVGFLFFSFYSPVVRVNYCSNTMEMSSQLTIRKEWIHKPIISLLFFSIFLFFLSFYSMIFLYVWHSFENFAQFLRLNVCGMQKVVDENMRITKKKKNCMYQCFQWEYIHKLSSSFVVYYACSTQFILTNGSNHRMHTSPSQFYSFLWKYTQWHSHTVKPMNIIAIDLHSSFNVIK